MVQQNLTAFSHSVDLRGPLTKDITAESFSERLVPFTLTTWLCLLFLYLIFFAHEMYAARVKPLWANEQKASSLMFQSSVLFYWFYWYVNEAMLLPVTLDFAVSMGQSATMSGFFISSSLIALILGLFMGRWAFFFAIWRLAPGDPPGASSVVGRSLSLLLDRFDPSWSIPINDLFEFERLENPMVFDPERGSFMVIPGFVGLLRLYIYPIYPSMGGPSPACRGVQYSRGFLASPAR